MKTIRRSWIAVLALLGVGAAPPLGGPPGFLTTYVGTPGTPHRIASGDLDGDGDMDLMVSCYAAATAPLFVLRQNNLGTFVPGWSASLGTEQFGLPPDLDLADMDLDGDIDALACIPVVTKELRLNAGNASFDVAKPLFGGTERVQQAPGLIDDDGIPDVAHYEIDIIGYVGWSKGLGDGSFQSKSEVPVSTVGFETRAELGDVNGDGLKDVVRASAAGLRYVPGKLIGGVPAWDPDVSVTTGPLADLALADLDGDARLDVVVTRTACNAMEVWFGQGTGLSGPSPFPGGATPGPLAVGDMDSDGFLDVVLASTTFALVTVNSNDGDGVFLDVAQYRGGRGATDLVATDLDGDGDTDLAETVQDARVVLMFNRLVP